MALAILEAYNYQDYVVPPARNRVASLLHIFKDIFDIFKIELRLIRPTPNGFRSTRDLEETELLTVDSLKTIARHKIKAVGEKSIEQSLI